MSKNRRFRKYNGNDKYHFRVYQKLRHPFLVTEVDYENHTISGYVITSSPTYKKAYYRLNKNPMPNDNRISYITSYRITDKWSLFSKPYTHWHLNSKDEMTIDIFEFKNKNKK